MKKLSLATILMFLFCVDYSQQTILLLRKKNKTIQDFWIGSTIAFQLQGDQWQKGEIIEIRNDSFYIRSTIAKYNLYSVDTFYLPLQGFSISDVYAMPKKGILVDYKNGEFQISRSGGHVHWYWIKSGWIFRVVGIGYAILNVANGLISNDFSFSENKTQLGIAAALIATGVLLKRTYKVTFKLGKKYHLQILDLKVKPSAYSSQ
jgi:hypothetical protein